MDLAMIQWPAMAATIAATWMIGSRQRRIRLAGFGLFLVSNVLWIAWGYQDGANALIVMQAVLAGINVRGALASKPRSGARTRTVTAH